MIESIKNNIRETIEKHYNLKTVNVEDGKIGNVDISVPLFSISKITRQNPKIIFDEVKDLIKNDNITEINFLNGFLNIQLNKKIVSKNVISEILDKKDKYGNETLDSEKVVVIDYSSPNIAKNFSVGHLRSTVIGNAIKNLYEKLGYKVVGINHLGDWGTQFGKMIAAYKMWGNKEDILNDPINELQKLYIKFHEEEKINSDLEQLGRDTFKKLEDQDPEMLELWQWFREESVKEFMQMYEILNVSFDSYNGEAFYNDKMDAVIDELNQKKLLKLDEGAEIVDLEKYALPPALIKRSDGATLYMTRDLAALFYRKKTYNFEKTLYVVGNEQRLHFNQLKAVTELMDYNFDIEHINFGLVLIDGKKMSTRGGKNKSLEAVINQAVNDAKEAISIKNPNLKDKDMVAKAVGVGAIIFNDLKNDRHLEVDFNLENMLKFEGQTGPYLQYSSVRIASILRENNLNQNNIDYSFYDNELYFDVIKIIASFPSILKKSLENHMPSVLSRYLINLAQSFNSFYGRQKIVVSDEKHLNANLALITIIRYILNEGMRILGIKSLDEM